MHSNYNKVILIGRLTEDPELFSCKNNKKIVEFRIAINREWNGKKEDPCYVTCKAWDDIGERISEFFKIGRPILVEGRLTLEKWIDKETKKKREKLVVTVERWEFVDSKKESSDSIPESAGNCGTEETIPEDFDSLVEEAVKSD